jgi:hypothetical protein
MSREAKTCRLVLAQGILPTTTTDEHPYYSREKHLPPGWIKASKLGKSLLAQVLPPIEDNNHTKEFWWVVGRYLADGWLAVCNGKGRVVICSNYNEAAEVEERLRVAGFAPCKDEDRTTVKFHITRKSFYEFLLPFGKYAGGKLLPGWVLSLPEDKAKSVLDGYFTGDGDKYKNRGGKIGGHRATSVSPALSLGIALLVQRGYGVVASTYRQEVSPTTIIEGRTVSQKTQYITKFCTNRNRQAFVEGDYGWKPVRKTEVTHGRTVRNISVEDDESYVANGAVVHNCQDISIAGKRAGLAGDRSGLWFEYARIVRELRPNWVLIENVPRLYSTDIDQVLGQMEEAGYACWPLVLGAWGVGAAHRRNRAWILCHADRDDGIGDGMGERWPLLQAEVGALAEAQQEGQGRLHELVPRDGVPGADAYAGIVRATHGIPDRVDRLRALGNAVVPQIPMLIGRFVRACEEAKSETKP